MITLDNASNNATMMSEIQLELNQLGISFDHEGNRIRYVFQSHFNVGLTALSLHTQMFSPCHKSGSKGGTEIFNARIRFQSRQCYRARGFKQLQ